VCAGKTRLSYAELDARANGLAWTLRSRGIGRGDRVGLGLERGSDMLAALLGILKSGAAYVPARSGVPRSTFALPWPTTPNSLAS
jgi:non-ribosomal peptide synthetase component F